MRLEKLTRLRSRLATPLTAEEYRLADMLFAEYCSRPQHVNRLTRELKASLRAAANSVAKHGLPPARNARLAYRMHKKRRAKQLAIAIYGDPNEPDTQTLIDRARDVPKRITEPPASKLS